MISNSLLSTNDLDMLKTKVNNTIDYISSDKPIYNLLRSCLYSSNDILERYSKYLSIYENATIDGTLFKSGSRFAVKYNDKDIILYTGDHILLYHDGCDEYYRGLDGWHIGYLKYDGPSCKFINLHLPTTERVKADFSDLEIKENMLVKIQKESWMD